MIQAVLASISVPVPVSISVAVEAVVVEESRRTAGVAALLMSAAGERDQDESHEEHFLHGESDPRAQA